MVTVFAQIELFSKEQDERALDLLLFPSVPLLPDTFSWKATLRSGGRKRTFSGKDQDEIISQARGARFNSVDVDYSFSPVYVPELQSTILSVGAGLILSPTNSLWMPTSEWPQDIPRSAQNQALNYSANERYLLRQNVRSFPTNLGVAMYFDGDVNDEIFYNWFIGQLSRAIPVKLQTESVCGGAALTKVYKDYDLRHCRLMPATVSLDTNPSLASTALCRRFLLLQQIMIGPYELCANLAQSLGSNGELAEVQNPSGKPMLGIVRVLSSFDNSGNATDPKTLHDAAPWLFDGPGTDARKED